MSEMGQRHCRIARPIQKLRRPLTPVRSCAVRRLPALLRPATSNQRSEEEGEKLRGSEGEPPASNPAFCGISAALRPATSNEQRATSNEYATA